MVLLLELARGLACLWIFFFHLRVLFKDSAPLIATIAEFGHLGVPMFFVISGYAITHAAESSWKANKSPLVFLRNRFRRIYPTFWASLLVVLILPYALELISSFKSGEYVMPASIITRFNVWEWFNALVLTKVFWADSSNLALEFAAVNTVYWTLAIEFQLYLVVFFALCLGKFYRHAIALVSIVAIALIFIPNSINFGLFIHYWPSFSVGIALAYLHRNELKFHVDTKRNGLILFAVTATTLLTLAYAPTITISTNFFIFALIFGGMLWFYADVEEVLKRWKNSGNTLAYYLLEPWLLLGTMSYSAYLLHLKLYLLPMMFARQIFETNNPAMGLVTIFATLVLSYPFYYFVERRFLSKNYKKLHQDVVGGGGPSPS